MDIKRYAGNYVMDDFSIVTLINDVANLTRTTGKAPEITRGLGTHRLNWPRSNIDPFGCVEHQHALLRHDAVRAARIAGLI